LSAPTSWWRYDRYEVHDGYIRPAPEATLSEFDPWRSYRTQTASGVAQPPHLQLLEVVASEPSGRRFSERIQANPDLANAITDWCSRNGLLGLLPHQVLSAQVGGRRIARTRSGWEDTPHFPDDEEPAFEVIEEEIGCSSILTQFDASPWARYFPTLRRSDWRRQQPVLPLTPRFWEVYSEPLSDFVHVARFLGDAIQILGARKPPAIDDLAGNRTATLNRVGALARLNNLTGVVTPQLEAKRGRAYRQVWCSPSLLGHLAMQVFQDLVGARRTVTCDCGVTISTAHSRARFCSERCGNRSRQRRRRRLVREARMT
jgi:hypothetical protein